MSKMEDYIKDVTKWNKELRDFLDSEDVEQNNELWQRLDHFTEIMDGINGPLDIEGLEKLQEQVDSLHSDMENYFSNRQQLGNIYMNEPYISAGSIFYPRSLMITVHLNRTSQRKL